MVDAPEGLGRGGVEEEEQAPEGGFVAFVCAGAEESSSGGFGDGAGGLDDEGAEGQGFVDEVGEAGDGRVRGEVLR